jgi:hypothetical protein
MIEAMSPLFLVSIQYLAIWIYRVGERERGHGRRERLTDIPPDKKVASRPILVVLSNLMFHTIGIGRTSMTRSVTIFGTLARL